MASVIGQILPLAVAVALSTVPIIAALLILSSPAKPRVSIALLVGWAAGVGVILGVFTIGLGLTYFNSRSTDGTIAGVFRIVLGSALIAYSITRFSRRMAAERTREAPKWMHTIDKTNAIGAVGFGFALALRPKNLILSIAAAAAITEAPLDAADRIFVILFFTVIGVSTVAAPIIAHLTAPEKTETPLNLIRDWIVKNSAPMTLLVILVTGAWIIGSGIARL